MMRKGAWTLESKSDSRWNCNGTGVVGGFQCPKEALDKIEELKKELGEEPPIDLEYSYHKY